MSKNLKFFVGVVAAFVVFATSASAAYMHTTTLKMGMTNANVMELQKALNANGFLVASVGAGSPGMESMYFGAKTKAAVQAFQAAKGLGNDGVVGPMTGAAVAALGGSPVVTTPGCPAGAMFNSMTGQPCNSSTPTPSTGGLSGGAGDLESADFISSVSNEDVGEDEANVKVLGLDLEADNGSDLSFTSIRVEFEEQGAGGSEKLEDYADEVSIWLGSTKVGSADVDDFNEDDDVYSKSITLSGAVVKAGDTGKLYVAVSGASNIDSDDLGASNNDWDVNVANLRYVDAQGAVVTESDLNDIGTETRDFQFVSFAESADVELKVSLNEDEDDINDAHTVTVNEDDNTDDVALLAFNMEAEGDSDISVSELDVKITTSDSDLSTVASAVKLFHGSEEIASEDIDSTSTSETINFDDLDIEIGAGDEEEFWIKVDLLEQDGNYSEGATIKAEITSTLVDAIEAEDESGEELSTSELTGSALGEDATLYVDGLSVTEGSHSATLVTVDGADNDYGAFTIRFSVTAGGDEDIYIAKDVTAASSASTSAIAVNTLNSSGSAETASGLTLSTTDSDATEETYTYKVKEGKTADFVLKVNAANADDSVRAILYGLAWGTDDLATPGNTYTTNMGVNGDYKTEYVFIND